MDTKHCRQMFIFAADACADSVAGSSGRRSLHGNQIRDFHNVADGSPFDEAIVAKVFGDLRRVRRSSSTRPRPSWLPPRRSRARS